MLKIIVNYNIFVASIFKNKENANKKITKSTEKIIFKNHTKSSSLSMQIKVTLIRLIFRKAVSLDSAI
jgi:hypothetical protein